MANRRKLTYVAVFIAICWAGWAALIGIFNVLAHFLKSSAAAVTLFLVILYSCLFGLLGWLVYTWKGRRDGWPSADKRERRLARNQGRWAKDANSAGDDESGWKRPQVPRGKRRE